MAIKFLDDVALADVAFEVRGKDLPELFRNAARAMLETQADPRGVRATERRSVRLSHGDPGRLLFRFLGELVFLKDAERFLAKKVDASVGQGPEGYTLEAELSGERIDEKRHELRNDVKAVTMHLFEVAKTGDGWVARVVVDI